MVKLIRFITLISEATFLQFAHVIGFVAFAVAAALGWYRRPSWWVPVIAVAFGVMSDKYIDQTALAGLLEKAHNANQRGGFLIVVYFAICAVGYITGAYGRQYMRNKGLSPALTKK